jgi:hypothetical protein
MRCADVSLEEAAERLEALCMASAHGLGPSPVPTSSNARAVGSRGLAAYRQRDGNLHNGGLRLQQSADDARDAALDQLAQALTGLQDAPFVRPPSGGSSGSASLVGSGPVAPSKELPGCSSGAASGSGQEEQSSLEDAEAFLAQLNREAAVLLASAPRDKPEAKRPTQQQNGATGSLQEGGCSVAIKCNLLRNVLEARVLWSLQSMLSNHQSNLWAFLPSTGKPAGNRLPVSGPVGSDEEERLMAELEELVLQSSSTTFSLPSSTKVRNVCRCQNDLTLLFI